MQTITPEKAVERGTFIIVLPTLVILAGIPMLAYYINLHYYQFSLWYVLPPFIIVSFVLSWVYWAWMVVKWKLWAYERVDDLTALKRQAVDRNLIYADGSWFNKTEIKTEAEIQRLAWLENNAGQRYADKLAEDELLVPEATAFYYKAWETWVWGALSLIAFWLGISYYLHPESAKTPKEIMMGKVVAIPAGIYLLYKFVTRLRRRKYPVLMLSNEGIYIGESNKTYSWNEVAYFDTIKYGKTDYVKIHTDKEYEIEIEFDATPSQLQHLHQLYCQRFIRNNTPIFNEEG